VHQCSEHCCQQSSTQPAHPSSPEMQTLCAHTALPADCCPRELLPTQYVPPHASGRAALGHQDEGQPAAQKPYSVSAKVPAMCVTSCWPGPVHRFIRQHRSPYRDQIEAGAALPMALQMLLNPPASALHEVVGPLLQDQDWYSGPTA